MFNELKNSILNLIVENKNKEITSQTNNDNAGIYMIYIDNFEDDKIIPFYIGQTNNFQTRFAEHYKKILALNRYSYELYLNLYKGFNQGGIRSVYDGEFMYCKVFSYMINHNCKLKDFHMIILEENAGLNLEEIEQKYFKKYLPAFFGFNQMNCISESRKDISAALEYKYLIEDGKNIEKYINYGYTRFNYLKGYYHSTSDCYPQELNNIIESLLKYYDVSEHNQIKKEFQKFKQAKSKYFEKKEKVEVNIDKIIHDDLKIYFDNNGLMSQTKFEEIILEFNNTKPNFVGIFKYCDRYATDKGEGLKKIIEKYTNRITAIKKQLIKKEIKYIQAKNNYLMHKYNHDSKMYDLIAPNGKYELYPLGDKYQKIVFPKIDEKNVCQICFDFSSDKKIKNDLDWIYPTELRLAIRYIGDSIVEKEFLFKNGLESIFVNNQVYYCEKSKFNPIIRGLDTMLSINVEYKTGINEFTLKENETHGVKFICDFIDELTNDNTKFVLYSNTQGLKSRIKDLTNKIIFTDSKFIYKLAKGIDKKKIYEL